MISMYPTVFKQFSEIVATVIGFFSSLQMSSVTAMRQTLRSVVTTRGASMIVTLLRRLLSLVSRNQRQTQTVGVTYGRHFIQREHHQL